ncbi:MAG: N-acetylmuramoyl-L-alanine amidase [Thermodesulfobacteriota bacterium]|nr:N-acetylmuramoyl-L-alanine amidase [Thermodesulfobacteriota bacterium]
MSREEGIEGLDTGQKMLPFSRRLWPFLKGWHHFRLGPLLFSLLILLLSGPAAAVAGEDGYRAAELAFQQFLKDPHKQKDRLNWILCIDRFRSIYRARPAGPQADDALFMTGRVYSELYKSFSEPGDRQEALDYYSRLLKRFPRSPYRSEASKAIAELDEGTKTGSPEVDQAPSIVPSKEGGTEAHPCAAAPDKPVVEKSPKPPVGSVGEARKPPPGDVTDPSALVEAGEKPVGEGVVEPQKGGLSEVTNLRFWSNPSYTRVVIDVDGEVPYIHRLLRKDPAMGKPQRLYVDLGHARMGANLKPIVPIGDDLLSDARAGQYTRDTVRVVLDIKSIDDFNIFSLRNPFRIVLDINGMPKKGPRKRPSKDEEEQPSGKIPDGALAKQLALGVRRIVIDPGHGGKDCGAIGYDKAVMEKNVTLEVSKRLARKIRKRIGCEAILTRDRDVFLSLEERTAIANTTNGDIFVSIHANAHRSRKVHGVETYLLNLATDREAIMVAARENATSTKNISDLETILNELMKNAKVNESSRLARKVQQAMVKELKGKYKKIKDNGVKQAPFYVLLGAEMPSILVEVAFISNPEECRRLNTASYQEDVVDGIVTGIEEYISEISPAVLTRAATVQAQR